MPRDFSRIMARLKETGSSLRLVCLDETFLAAGDRGSIEAYRCTNAGRTIEPANDDEITVAYDTAIELVFFQELLSEGETISRDELEARLGA